MKKTFIILTFATGLLAIAACNNTDSEETNATPQLVVTSFNEKFPDANSVEWEKENENEWEAEFKLNNINYSANFLNDGTWKETEHEIEVQSLPESVQSTLKNDFSRYKIEETEITETPDYTAYEVEIEKGGSTMEVVIDSEGKVLKKKEAEDEEDDNE